jgi:hypothetical protein
MNYTDQQLMEIRLELLRERIDVERDIARTLSRILMLAERCIEQSPWAQRILAGVYMEKGK